MGQATLVSAVPRQGAVVSFTMNDLIGKLSRLKKKSALSVFERTKIENGAHALNIGLIIPNKTA